MKTIAGGTERRVLLACFVHRNPKARAILIKKATTEYFGAEEHIEIRSRMGVLLRAGKDLGSLETFADDPTLSEVAVEAMKISGNEERTELSQLSRQECDSMLDRLRSYAEARVMLKAVAELTDTMTGKQADGTMEKGKAVLRRAVQDMDRIGSKGTIDAAAVEKALGKKTRAVEACRRQHIGSFSYVGGDITFFFEIGMDGVPTKVFIEKSQLGHWQMEACILGVAKSLKFVKPKGGKAEVRYSMALADNGTKASDWDEDKAKPTLKKKRRALRACRKGGKPKSFTLTFYVLPGGSVKTVGVASSVALPAGFAACVSKVVTAQTFADPLGSVARATYTY